MREGDRAWGPRPSVGLPPGGRDLVMSARGSASQNARDDRCRGQKIYHQEAADPRLRWIALFYGLPNVRSIKGRSDSFRAIPWVVLAERKGRYHPSVSLATNMPTRWA